MIFSLIAHRKLPKPRINLTDSLSHLNHKVCNYNLAQLLVTLSFKSLSTQKAWHVFGPIALLCFRCHSSSPLQNTPKYSQKLLFSVSPSLPLLTPPNPLLETAPHPLPLSLSSPSFEAERGSHERPCRKDAENTFYALFIVTKRWTKCHRPVCFPFFLLFFLSGSTHLCTPLPGSLAEKRWLNAGRVPAAWGIFWHE